MAQYFAKQFDSFLKVKPSTCRMIQPFAPREKKMYIHTMICTKMFLVALFANPQIGNNQIFINKWVNKQMVASPSIVSLLPGHEPAQIQGKRTQTPPLTGRSWKSQCRKSMWDERDCWTCPSVFCIFPWEYHFKNPAPHVKLRTQQNDCPTAWHSAPVCLESIN